MEVNGERLLQFVRDQLHEIVQVMLNGVSNWDEYVYLRSRAAALVDLRATIEQEMNRVSGGDDV